MKKYVKRVFTGMMSLAMIFSMAACGSGSGETATSSEENKSETTAVSAESTTATEGIPDTSNASVVLKMGHIQSEQDPWQLGAQKFADECAILSNGDIRVEIYPNSTLGGDRDLAEGMQMGTVDMALIAGVLSNFDDSISILEIPYLFRSSDEFEKVIYGDIGNKIADNVLNSSGIRILDWWERGPRLITSNKPINSVDDMKGLKIRIPEISAMQSVFNAWGAAATTMAWSEVYSSLQQGVIEAEENPVPFFYSGSIYEVNKYIANTNHKYEYVTMSISDQTYSKLTDDQKDILQKAAKAATELENELVAEVTDKDLKDMVENHGVTVTDPDTTGFIEKADAVAPAYAESIGQKDLYEEIQKALGR